MRLQNQDIWLAYPKLVELSKFTLPVETSMGVAKLMKALQGPYIQIEHERRELVRRYGKREEGTDQVEVEQNSPSAGDYALAFGELLTRYWEEDIQFKKVRLPLKVSAFCNACGHEMRIVFLVEPQLLLPLREHFVEAC